MMQLLLFCLVSILGLCALHYLEAYFSEAKCGNGYLSVDAIRPVCLIAHLHPWGLKNVAVTLYGNIS